MTELATAYVAVRADTRNMKGDIASGLQGVDMDGEGKRAGERFGAGFRAAAAGIAAAGLFSFGRGAVEAYKEAEQASNRLSDAYEKFPALADVSRESFDKLNQAVMTKTRFDDDAVASGQAVLAQWGLTGSQLQELTPLVADYAAKMGIDLPSAAQQVGKALDGNGKALKNVGIDFADTGTRAGNLDQVMGGLRQQVGGFAEKEGQTASGTSERLKNQFGEFQETVGSGLVPALSGLMEKLLGVAGFVQENSAVIGPLVAVVGGFAISVWAVNAAVGAWSAIQAASTAVTGVFTAAVHGLNAAFRANPIGVVVTALGLLVAGVIWAWNNVEWFRNGVTAAWEGIKAAAETVVRWFTETAWPFLQRVWEGIQTGVGALAGFFSERWETIRSAVGAVVSWFTDTLFPAMGRANEALGRGFEAVGRVISTVWEGLKEAAAAPIRFVVNTVFGGVVDAFNKVSGFVGGPQIDKPTLGFAAGGFTGSMPWDKVAGVVHGGEYVVRASSTGKIMRDMPGLLPWLNGYADGGLVGWLKSAGSAIAGGVSGVFEFFKDPLGALRGVVDSLVGAAESTTIGKMAVAAVRKVVGSLVDKIKSFAGSVAGMFGGAQVEAGRVSFGGKLLDSDTFARITQALGGAFRLNQGSWSTSVAASAGTHAGSGVADLTPTGLGWLAAESALRAAGLIAWFRNWTGNQHIHLVNPNVTGLSPQALSQVLSFQRGGNGLAFMRGGFVPTFDRGGTLAPGLNLVNNGTGRPEPLVPADGRVYLVLEDGTELRAYVSRQADARIGRTSDMAAAGRRTV